MDGNEPVQENVPTGRRAGTKLKGGRGVMENFHHICRGSGGRIDGVCNGWHVERDIDKVGSSYDNRRKRGGRSRGRARGDVRRPEGGRE